MIERHRYTEKEIRELLKSMVILVDTREQKNSHITDFFEEHKIPFKKRKLNHGDYSFYIPKNEDLGICRDMFFEKDFAIERKSGLDELIGNLTQDRVRLKNEFATRKCEMYLMIESSQYDDIVKGNYRSKLKPNTLVANIHSISHEFGIPFVFIPKETSALYIYSSCYYYLRNLIK